MIAPTRVAVGMSGGIDSSVAAALLAEQGHEVIGLTLHMVKDGSRCCSLEDVNRARLVCAAVGIRHYTINVVDDFREKIIRPFADAYAEGRTPNPCINCNRDFKFGAMLERARQLGCAHLATGHYVRIEQRADGYHLFRGRDPQKDQSYFLHRLSQDQLSRILFPLGGMTKPEVRAYAEEKHLPVQGARETYDLCFITAAGPAPFVEKYHPELRQKGAIVDEAGQPVGEHEGFHHFTIGQRKGMGIAAAEPLYVKQLRPERNEIVVANRTGVYSTGCELRDVFWTTPTPPASGSAATVRLRYRHEGVAATLIMKDTTSWSAEFQRPQFAVAPGQAAVIYAEDEVLGGGWIDRAIT